MRPTKVKRKLDITSYVLLTCAEKLSSENFCRKRQNWVEDGGEKAQRRIPTDYLDWALSDFSGYIAADELYDGPFCVLSIVDNRAFKRLSDHVLDRDPTQVDVEAFFRRYRQALEARGLTVQGITTDGSTLYPEPIAAVFGAVPHQVCQFHVLHEVNKAVLSAVAQERKRLAAGAPKLPRGRPSSKEAKRAARRKKRIEQKVGELFAHRYLFVQRRLSPPSGRRSSGSAAAGRNCAACAG